MEEAQSSARLVNTVVLGVQISGSALETGPASRVCRSDSVLHTSHQTLMSSSLRLAQAASVIYSPILQVRHREVKLIRLVSGRVRM